MATLNYRRHAFLLLFIVLKSVVYAQTDYQAKMDSIFIIPAYKVTTGLLINRSPEIIKMQNFKLQLNANNVTVINARNWLELFYRLYGSHLNMNSFGYDITLAQKYPDKAKEEQISLGLIYYHYDKIKNDAIQNGLLSIDTLSKKVTDISLAGQSPLVVDTCFAASSLVDTVMIGINQFLLKDSLIVSNKISDIQEIHIDFDNGLGYVRVYPNQPITVSYGSIGNKTITTKIIVGSLNYYASSHLYVKTAPPLLRSAVAANVPMPDLGPYEYNDNINNITAYYGIWYRCNHNNTIRKPILIVSGFDPSDMIRIAGEKPEGNPKAYLYSVANKNGFLDRLREFGYDIIIYRSGSSTESIIDNAMNLVNFMQEKVINVKTSDNELVVLGASMGGLVCRYALTYMEYHNIPHKTRLFISMDSPQNGANVPLGFQYMAYYLNKDLLGLVPQLSGAINNQLGCVAAKQMLIYHYDATIGNTAGCHVERTNYLSSLASIGNFPQQCTTMAISLGSGIGTTQGFTAGATLIKKSPSPLVTASLLTLDLVLMLFGIPPTIGVTLNSASWEFEVNAVPNQTSKSIYSETISLDICIPQPELHYKWWWAFLGWPPIIDIHMDCGFNLIDRNIVVNNTMPLDNAPASVRYWHSLKDFDLAEVGQFLNSVGVTNIDQNPDAFIPAYSALGLNIPAHQNIKNYLNTSTNVERLSPTLANYHFYRNSNPAVSPFDYLYVENHNDDHIFDDNMEGVFSAEMLLAMKELVAPYNLNLEDRTIHSGESFCYEALGTITVNGNFIVEPGGRLELRAERIVLNPGFKAEAGSSVSIIPVAPVICPPGTIQSSF